jgi:N-acetylmuramoyl-L-alanine amidase
MRAAHSFILAIVSALAITACGRASGGGSKPVANAQGAMSVVSSADTSGSSRSAPPGPSASDADPSPASGARSGSSGAGDPSAASTAATGKITGRPLAGKVIVLDPGHQYGSQFHLKQINQQVDAGGFKKACNTTGTQTDAGYPESAFTMAVAGFAKTKLEALGATVYLTRPRESRTSWGPCIDARGKTGGKYNADAVVSIHGDGESPDLHGFFVIQPALRKGWTDDIFVSSKKLATAIHAGLIGTGLQNANYVGGDGYDVRGDLGTLNWESKPVVLIEMGNMRNATDARHMQAPPWQRDIYAQGIVRGLVTFLT